MKIQRLKHKIVPLMKSGGNTTIRKKSSQYCHKILYGSDDYKVVSK